MFSKTFFESLLGAESPPTTRAESPKLSRERKIRDSVSSPTIKNSPISRRALRHSGGKSSIVEDVPFSSRYTVLKTDFAKGAYGKISLAFDRVTSQQVIIKNISKNISMKMIQNEVNAGKIIGYHPNIATFHSYKELSDNHALVFQFIDGCDLFSFLEDVNFVPQDESDCRELFTSLIKALQHVHSKSISHRDIKLENILIDKLGNVSLIDFGLCSFVEDGSRCRDAVGSEHYIAPEIMRRSPYSGYKADVFSAGVVLFSLLFGVFPFDCLRLAADSNLPKLTLRFPMDVNVSAAAKDLLIQMLRDDPSRRISVDGILKHEWITGSQEPALYRQSSE